MQYDILEISERHARITSAQKENRNKLIHGTTDKK